MAQAVRVVLISLDRQMVEALASDRNRSHKHIERAKTVLAAAGCDPVQRIAALLGVSRQ